MNKFTGICLAAIAAVVLFANGSFAGGVPVPPKCLALGEIINGVPTPDQKCCAGLQLSDIKQNYDKNCVNLGAGGYGGICLACGNGVCDPAYETVCNCPQDCTKVKKDKDDDKDKDKDKDKNRNGHDDDHDRGDHDGMMHQ